MGARTAGEEIIKQPHLVDQIHKYNKFSVFKTIGNSIYIQIYIFYTFMCGVYLNLVVHENKVGDGIKYHTY